MSQISHANARPVFGSSAGTPSRISSVTSSRRAALSRMDMTTPRQQTQPRRSFLKAVLYGMTVPGFWLLRAFQKRAEALTELANPPLVIPYVPSPGIRFYGKVITVATAERLSVFSSACPHLGCRIDRAEGTELVCPCHGSRFNESGEPTRTPAARGLRRLKYEHDTKQAVLRVFLETT